MYKIECVLPVVIKYHKVMVSKVKTIENRKYELTKHKENVPIFIQCSQTRAIDNQIVVNKNMHGKVIGYCKFENVSEKKALEIDPVYMQLGRKHWHVKEAVLFDKHDWKEIKGYQNTNPCYMELNEFEKIQKILSKYNFI